MDCYLQERLEKVNANTHVVLEFLVNRLSNKKYHIVHEDRYWTKANLKYLSKPNLFTTRTCIKHIKLLIEIGLIEKKRLEKSVKDHTNYYAINPEALVGGKLWKLRGYFKTEIEKGLRAL